MSAVKKNIYALVEIFIYLFCCFNQKIADITSQITKMSNSAKHLDLSSIEQFLALGKKTWMATGVNEKTYNELKALFKSFNHPLPAKINAACPVEDYIIAIFGLYEDLIFIEASDG